MQNTKTTPPFSLSSLLQKMNHLSKINVNKNKPCLLKLVKIFSLILLHSSSSSSLLNQSSSDLGSSVTMNTVQKETSLFESMNSFQPFNMLEINSFKSTSEKIFNKRSKTFKHQKKHHPQQKQKPSKNRKQHLSFIKQKQ
eukprot:TRINITY_DN13760_c0_g1_i1.p2 TRINITY_DN13760_c0_g1~~TRINITY_DN13760_c0_g1_i1.p2  ORF type:complete len:140 (-),score=48.24 TRINITY_DN13760_c0_g1_i1:598-1017(-)